jgi:hypothetical protein
MELGLESEGLLILGTGSVFASDHSGQRFSPAVRDGACTRHGTRESNLNVFVSHINGPKGKLIVKSSQALEVTRKILQV